LRRSFRRAAAALTATLVLITGAQSRLCSAQTPAADAVTTLAGDGIAGLRDGAAAHAEFLKPFAVAYGSDGDLYIVDQAAQRIRRLHGGVVSTVAGGGDLESSGLNVAGGYHDGPALQARFNGPTGIAIANDGTIYIADANNHCIRSLKDGVVNTYAGSPLRHGHDDGDRKSATFEFPRGIAVARDGTVYVADQGNGLRVVSAQTVSTLRPKAARGGATPPAFELGFTALALDESGDKRTLYISMRDGVGVLTLPAAEMAVYRSGGSFADTPYANPDVEGYRAIGFPMAAIPVAPDFIVYSDAWNHRIRILREAPRGTTFADTIDGPLDENGADDGAFRDGPAAESRFDGPAGLALGRDGRIAVADSGNRRIRLLPPFDRRQQTELGELAAASGSYRIVYIGNSFTFWNTNWRDSIPARMESALQARAPAMKFPRPPRVFAISLFLPVDDMAGYIREFLAQGLADAVVWQFDTAYVTSSYYSAQQYGFNLTSDSSWQPKVTASVRSASVALAAAHIPLAIATAAFPWEFSPNEELWGQEYAFPLNPDPASYNGTHEMLMSALEASGATVYDTWADLSAIEKSPDHPALYHPRDFHLSRAGNAALADAIVRHLEAERPWLAGH
jgi:hypothetical protein